MIAKPHRDTTVAKKPRPDKPAVDIVIPASIIERQKRWKKLLKKQKTLLKQSKKNAHRDTAALISSAII